MAEIFKWDGSYLGRHLKSIVVATTKVDKKRFCQITIQNETAIGILKIVRNTTACIVDEMKILFGLPKLGTHNFHLENHLCLFIRGTIDNYGSTVDNLMLKDIKLPQPIDSKLLFQVQSIFCFRDILGIATGNEGTVAIISPLSDRPYPVSVNENTFNFYERKSLISNVLMKKWFGETSPSSVLAQMIYYDPSEMSISETLSLYRSELEKIINRIDKNMIWISVFIIERMMRKMVLF